MSNSAPQAKGLLRILAGLLGTVLLAYLVVRAGSIISLRMSRPLVGASFSFQGGARGLAGHLADKAKLSDRLGHESQAQRPGKGNFIELAG